MPPAGIYAAALRMDTKKERIPAVIFTGGILFLIL
jgi:soluble P-type ATPase